MCDVSFFAAREPPPPAAELPDGWEGEVLGTRAEVCRKISECIPHVDWSRPDVGTCAGRGFGIEFDLGHDEPIRKLTVRLHGGRDGYRLVSGLLRWGWFALLDSEREWLHHCDDATLLGLIPHQFPEEPA